MILMALGSAKTSERLPAFVGSHRQESMFSPNDRSFVVLCMRVFFEKVGPHWHEIVTKILPRELVFAIISDGTCTLETFLREGLVEN